ncbi:MAG: hypothetical protein AB7P18_25785 [Candidatus Binatia bacterium]
MTVAPQVVTLEDEDTYEEEGKSEDRACYVNTEDSPHRENVSAVWKDI